MISPTKDAYKLFHEGQEALAVVEASGIRLDMDYLEKTSERAREKSAEIEEKLKDTDIWKKWKKKFRGNSNIASGEQLGEILFSSDMYEPKKRTKTGRPDTSEEALLATKDPFVEPFLNLKKLRKMESTYLRGLIREADHKGYLHPSFGLNKAVTYRSTCIRKGTLIEVVRDIAKNPKGIPIEDVRAGDLIYCYDDEKKLALRKVKWAGKTGKKELVRVHWRSRAGKGFLDVTPEHRIRVVNGSYIEAQHLLDSQDFRDESVSHRLPKRKVLALARTEQRLYSTGSPTILDHRFVYEQSTGPLLDSEVVHHKDRNHSNNIPGNLEKMTPSGHGRLHALAGHCWTDEDRRRGNEIYRQKLKSGEIVPLRGKDSPLWKNINKFGLLRMLAKAKGQSSKVGMDFDTFKKKADLEGIDLKVVKDRYQGSYISLGRLRQASKYGQLFVQKTFVIGYYRAKRILKERGLPYGRTCWKNQSGRGVLHNHEIVDVEWIKEVDDVYDIEVEEFHNFIAGEICVHNSSQPNFQNVPIRDPRLGKMIRRAFIPRDGRVLVEIDYSAIEVRIAACYHKDPTMLEYIRTGHDLHTDMAVECFSLKPDQVSKQARFEAKSCFVFAQFYGDWWKSVAKALWGRAADLPGLPCIACGGSGKSSKGGPCVPCGEQGEASFYDHLASKGFGSLEVYEKHIERVENRFWKERFPRYDKWRDHRWEEYKKNGYFRLKTGFVCQGIYSRNETINYAVQGAAFHCLLWSLTQLVKEFRLRELESLVVGQIHDSVILDVPEKELEEVLRLARDIMCERLREHWPWIITPLEIEAEGSRKNWFEKQDLEIP